MTWKLHAPYRGWLKSSFGLMTGQPRRSNPMPMVDSRRPKSLVPWRPWLPRNTRQAGHLAGLGGGGFCCAFIRAGPGKILCVGGIVGLCAALKRVEMCKARANSVARMRSYVCSTLTDVVAANAGTHTAASIRKLRWQSTFATTAPWDYGSRLSPGRRDPLTSSRRSARTNSRRRGWCGSRRAWSGLARSCGGCA